MCECQPCHKMQKNEKKGAKREKSGTKYTDTHFSFIAFRTYFHVFCDKCIASLRVTEYNPVVSQFEFHHNLGTYLVQIFQNSSSFLMMWFTLSFKTPTRQATSRCVILLFTRINLSILRTIVICHHCFWTTKPR